jgi:hypothetical protein
MLSEVFVSSWGWYKLVGSDANCVAESTPMSCPLMDTHDSLVIDTIEGEGIE